MKARTRSTTFLGHLLKIEQICSQVQPYSQNRLDASWGSLGVSGALHRPGGVNGSMNLRDRTEKESSS